MKTYFLGSVVFLKLVMMIADATAGSDADMWQSNRLAWHFHPSEITFPEAISEESFIEEIVFSGEVTTTSQVSGILYAGYINRQLGIGEIQFLGTEVGHELRLSWSFASDSAHLTLQTGTGVVSYSITPVLIQSEHSDQLFGSVGVSELFPQYSSTLEAVLNSPEVLQVLPLALNRGLGLQASMGVYESAGFDDICQTTAYENEWACSLTCGGVLGTAALTIVSGGILGPGVVIGAAACGSCMGFIWGDQLTSQPPISLPSGSTAPIGSILPPLPPGWVWVCTANQGGGYTCELERTESYTQPY